MFLSNVCFQRDVVAGQLLAAEQASVHDIVEFQQASAVTVIAPAVFCNILNAVISPPTLGAFVEALVEPLRWTILGQARFELRTLPVHNLVHHFLQDGLDDPRGTSTTYDGLLKNIRLYRQYCCILVVLVALLLLKWTGKMARTNVRLCRPIYRRIFNQITSIDSTNDVLLEFSLWSILELSLTPFFTVLFLIVQKLSSLLGSPKFQLVDIWEGLTATLNGFGTLTTGIGILVKFTASKMVVWGFRSKEPNFRAIKKGHSGLTCIIYLPDICI